MTVAAAGDTRLYPAMPYPAYTKMTREDALAIRAYLRTIDPAMPSFAWRLSDAQAAAVVTYIRNAWGNAAAAVSPDQVRTVKGKRGHLD